MKMEPAPYPAKNTEEIKAVIGFLALLDVERVKPDAKFLDKVPNLDGSVELVDQQQRTVGELKVQIKKIPDGSLQFDCPIELVAYSTRVSSPFLLVCVDVGNRKAYWCHISSVMAGIKPEQKTFTVRFQPVVDEIGNGFPYFERWCDLCSDYLKRVSEFPKLERKVDEEIGLNKLAQEDRRLFQQFIEEVNVLLDVDLPIIKHECFADTWKLGVSIHRVDAEAVAYSIYTIPNGENAPLVIHQPEAGEQPRITTQEGVEIGGIISFHLEGGPGADVSTQWVMRNHFGKPIEAAREFVFRYLVRLLREKRLHVHGRHQSVELLMWFTREYAHTLGLPVSDTYMMADLSYGINIYLPAWYSLTFPRTMEFFRKHYGEMLNHNPWPSLRRHANTARQSVQATEAEVRDAISSHLRLVPYPVRTYDFSFQALRQAIEFLVAANVQKISRPDRPWSKHGTWVWNCYTPEDMKHNVVAMLQGAAEDYPEFVKGNRFGRLNSPLILGEVAMVVSADPRKWQDSIPTVNTYVVKNADRSLPLMTFIDLSEEPEGCFLDGETSVLRGVRRECIQSGWSSLIHFNDQRRTRAMLYDWLKMDMERRFGETLSVYVQHCARLRRQAHFQNLRPYHERQAFAPIRNHPLPKGGWADAHPVPV